MTKLELRQWVKLVSELNDNEDLLEVQHLDVVASALNSGFINRYKMEESLAQEIEYISSMDTSNSPCTAYARSFNYNL